MNENNDNYDAELDNREHVATTFEEANSVDQDISEIQHVRETNEMQDDQMINFRDNSGIFILDILNDSDFEKMHSSLASNEKVLKIHDWKNISLELLKEKLGTKELINAFFRKIELQICVKTIMSKLQEHGVECHPNWPKYRVVELFTTKRTLKKNIVKNTSRTNDKRLPTSKSLCVKRCKLLPKEYLAKRLAEITWPNVLKEWYNSNSFPNIGINHLVQKVEWFSQPLVTDNGLIRFHFTDACHVLTCLRTKLCTTGISGLLRKAWEEAALSTTTKLNIAMIVECVDKQDLKHFHYVIFCVCCILYGIMYLDFQRQ
jgi:hypothetical protein